MKAVSLFARNSGAALRISDLKKAPSLRQHHRQVLKQSEALESPCCLPELCSEEPSHLFHPAKVECLVQLHNKGSHKDCRDLKSERHIFSKHFAMKCEFL